MIVANVGLLHAVVVKVVLFVASGGGGSRARPTVLTDRPFWRAPGGVRERLYQFVNVSGVIDFFVTSGWAS